MKTVYAEIITIGDEILYGQITDTNSQWISSELDKIGIKTIQKTTIGDTEPAILRAFAEAETRADLILITGGLGPTNDDLTKPCLAKYFECEVTMHPQALEELTAIFNHIGREVTELNRQQAALPLCCRMISNKVGTAAGMWFEKDNKVFVSMPGVPHEMKTMMTDYIIPDLQEFFHTPVIYHRLIKTVGIGESWLADKIKTWEDNLPEHIKLAYLPNLGQVRLRLTAIGSDVKTLRDEVATEVANVKPLIEKYIYGYDQDLLEQEVGRHLREQSKTISCAESCTGGSVAQAITSVPGSSDYFIGGVIPYSNKMKVELLGVSAGTIEKHGAVSEATVGEMALRVRKLFGTSIGVASSGIAGPGGGSEDKPVGTVWIALANGGKVITKKLSLFKNRKLNVRMSTVAILNLIRQSLVQND